MKREHIFTCALLLILTAVIILKPMYGSWLRAALAPARVEPSAVVALGIENQKLKSELAELQNIKSQLPQKPEGYIRGLVYSRYPFNFKNELLLNAGGRENVKEGKTVLFGHMFIGRINRVFEDSSRVQTVYDDSFQLAVKIGSIGAQALLRGGSTPALTLIPLAASVKKGDIAYSSAPDVPHGLPIGEVNEVKISSDKLFQEASLTFAYDINDIGTVFIEQ